MCAVLEHIVGQNILLATGSFIFEGTAYPGKRCYGAKKCTHSLMPSCTLVVCLKVLFQKVVPHLVIK